MKKEELIMQMRSISYSISLHEGILKELKAEYTRLWKEKEEIERSEAKVIQVTNKKKATTTILELDLDLLTYEEAEELLQKLRVRKEST
jgi:hypothetical protein